MFPNGWPGRGLLLLRTSLGLLQIHQALVAGLSDHSSITHVASAIAGLLLLLGVWTPAVALLLAVLEVAKLYWGMAQPEQALFSAAVALSIAMLGPGVWSIDAALFGRHRLELPKG
jgi:uncharacterized membrane protein YphA (DoxX/SURF4 family)